MNWLLWFISPTLAIAGILKKRFDRTRVICTLNAAYLIIAVAFMVTLWIAEADGTFELRNHVVWSIFFGFYVWSRSFEILFAFIRDALDKTDPERLSSSLLTPKKRVELALRSYLELILIFGLAYRLMPENWWNDQEAPESVLESVYFSGVTITTLGFGDTTPSHIIPQLLTVFEVICGFALLIVSFAIYAGLKRNDRNDPQ